MVKIKNIIATIKRRENTITKQALQELREFVTKKTAPLQSWLLQSQPVQNGTEGGFTAYLLIF